MIDLAVVAGTLMSGVIAWFFWDLRQLKLRSEKHNNEIITLKVKTVNEDKVRAIIKAELSPIIKDLDELKRLIHELLLK